MPKRRLCPACELPFIKGRRVHFAARTGMRIATVCGPCADGGVTIVQDNSGDLAKCMNCPNPAVVCLACVARKVKEARG